MLAVAAVALVLALLPWSLAVFSLIVPALVARWWYLRMAGRLDVSPRWRTTAALSLGLSVYPVQFLILFYFTWLAASLVLGHPPQRSLDDVKSIGFLVDVIDVATMWLGFWATIILAAHALLLMGWVNDEIAHGNRCFIRIGPFWLLPILLWGLTYALLISDPVEVLLWFRH